MNAPGTDGARVSRPGRWSLRVTVWLVALAIVPLLGAAWFAHAEVSRVADARRQAEAKSSKRTSVAQ